MAIHQPVLFSLLTVITCIGCMDTAFIQTAERYLPGAKKRALKQRPTRILCLWEGAEGQGIDGRPARGFAGQILFFGPSGAEPVPVHGTVRIYEYDDFAPDDPNPKPIQVFVFDDLAWNVHRTESTVGESYNVFLPYVKPHNGLAACALKVEFLPDDGNSIFSPITEITLEPRQRRTRTQSTVTRNVLRKGQTPQPAAASQPVASDAAGTDDRNLETLTIRLPSNSR